jgi:phage terminase large subunit GpA-like protein
MLSLDELLTGRFLVKSPPTLEQSLASQIASRLDELALESLIAEKPTLLEWVQKHRVILDKKTGELGAFKFTEYPWLLHLYNEIGTLAPDWTMVIRKAAQMGLTEMAINLAFYIIDEHRGRVFYALPPGQNVVGDFAHERISPAIAQSPHIQAMAGDTDNVGLKTFKRGALYLRGTSVPQGRPDKAPQLASVPADAAIIDEVDRVPPAAIPLIEDRMGDSRLKAELLLSTPTYPGVGIDAAYQTSDQREPMIQCQECGRWHWLVWDLVAERDGQVRCWCPTCKAAIDRVSAWEHKRIKWVAQNPESDVVGFWISKLLSPRVDLTDLWERSKSTEVDVVLAFHNNDLGVGYEPEGARLTLELLRACADDYDMPDTASWCAMGVDVGYVLNVWIMQPLQDGRQRAVYIDEVLNWEDLDRLMVRYGVRVCVVDDGPELTADIAFARRHRGRVFLANYTENMDGADWCRWNLKSQKVTIDRTHGLDRSHGDIEAQVDSLPRDFELIGDFTQQMTVNLKTKGVKADGTVYYHFPKTGKPDHYDHAHVYCLAAMERLKMLQRARGTDETEQEALPSTGERRYRGRL